MDSSPKFNLELKQTVKGEWYVGSVKINAETIEELNQLIDVNVNFLKHKLEEINPVDNFSKDFNSERKESDIYYNHKPEPKKILPEEIILSNEEKILFEKLKKIRMDLSAQENVPPYFIFHDSVLKRLTRYKPLTREEMLKLPGIGENNFGKYGVHFLKALRTEKFTEKTEAQGIENEKIENKNLDIPNIGELNNVP